MADEVEFDYLSKVKLLLGIDDESKDEVLTFHIELVRNEILNYCNRSDFPSALNFTLCQMVADVFRDNQRGNSTGNVVGNVSSISEDGRSVSFTNGNEIKTAIEDKISRTRELNRYKLLFRRD